MPRERDPEEEEKPFIATSDYVTGHWKPVQEEIAVEGVSSGAGDGCR